MSDATYTVEVDLDQSRLFDAGEDVAADVIGAGGPMLVMERGHDLTRVLSPPFAGSLGFTLNNASGDYSPGGDFRSGEDVRVRATLGGDVYDLWRGFLDHPTQTPPGGDVRFTKAQAFGSFARLAGRNVSSELYSNITTDVAIGHLLDAAGYIKNLQDFMTYQTVRGAVVLASVSGWDLASTSGDDPGTNGHILTPANAVITLGAGSRGQPAIEDSGTLTMEFDGAATKATAADNALLWNIFATGGLGFCAFLADTDGESHEGTLFGKNVWRLYAADQSGSAMRLRFTHGYSGTAGIWQTTSRVVTVGTRYLVAVYFNKSAGVAADPTIWLFDIDNYAFSTLTVGSGLTETQTPVGTATTDVGSDFVIGNNSGATRTWDGRIGTVRLFSQTFTGDGTATFWTPYLRGAASVASNAPRHFDVGQTVLDWWWVDNEDVLNALATLKNSEGPGAALYEDATGAIVFKNRHARNTDARSTVVQTEFGSGSDDEPLLSHPFSNDLGLKDVVNICEIEIVNREAQALGEVWALGETITLAAGEVRKYIARSSSGDPFQNAVVPTVIGGDFIIDSGGSVTVSLDHTSGPQVTITISSTIGSVVSGLRLRAELVTIQNTSVVGSTIDTATSQSDFGIATYRLQTRKEISINLAQDFCNAVVGFYQNGRAVTSIHLDNNKADERMLAALTRDVGDRVHVHVGTDIDDDMYIEHVRHEVISAGYHVTTFGLESAQDVVSYITLDSSVLDGSDVLAF